MVRSFTVEQLEQALIEAGQDEPTKAELDGYKRLFQHVNRNEQTVLQQVTEWLQAHLVWDSRHEPLLQGMRNAAQDGYRLRFVADTAIIELAIENDGRVCNIEGEIYGDDEDDVQELLLETDPAFITLLHNGEIVGEAVSDADGRFGFYDLNAQTYGMTFFLGNKARVELVDIKIL